MPAAWLKQVVEAVTQCDVVALQERSVLHIVVRQLRSDLVGLPVSLNSTLQTVREVLQRVREPLTCIHVTHALLNIVIYIVADACTQRETEVPVLVFQARREAHGYRSCWALVEILIAFIDLTVTVTVNYAVLNWLAILVINLLVNIEWVHSVTHLVSLQISTRTITYLDVCINNRSTILWYTIQVGNLVLVVSEVVCHGPEPVLGLDSTPGNSCFNTGILQGTDVLPCLVLVTCHRRKWSIVQQIGSLSVVPIYATRQSLIQDTPVQTYVVGRGCFPLQVRTVVIWSVKFTLTSNWIETICTCADRIRWNPLIIADRTSLLTSLTITQTELQVRQPVSVLQECFFVSLPCKSEWWEPCPVLLETWRTIITNGCCQEVTVEQCVVGTSEERYQVAFALLAIWSMRTLCASKTCIVICIWIITYIVIVLAAPEVLPLITSHDVEMMNLIEILVVLSVSTQREVALQNFLTTVAAIVQCVCARCSKWLALATLWDICTQGSMQSQVLETVYLIVDVCTTDEWTAVSNLTALIQQRQRVRHLCGAVISERPCIVTKFCFLWPLEIATIVVESLFHIAAQLILVVLRCKLVWILSRVHSYSWWYYRTISI